MIKINNWMKRAIEDNSSTIEINGSRRIGKTTFLTKLCSFHRRILYISQSTAVFSNFIEGINNNEILDSSKKPSSFEYTENGEDKFISYRNYKELKTNYKSGVCNKYKYPDNIDLIIFEEVNPSDDLISHLRSSLNYYGQIYITHTTPPKRKTYTITHKNFKELTIDLKHLSKEARKEFTLEPDVWKVKKSQAIKPNDYFDYYQSKIKEW